MALGASLQGSCRHGPCVQGHRGWPPFRHPQELHSPNLELVSHLILAKPEEQLPLGKALFFFSFFFLCCQAAWTHSKKAASPSAPARRERWDPHWPLPRVLPTCFFRPTRPEGQEGPQFLVLMLCSQQLFSLILLWAGSAADLEALPGEDNSVFPLLFWSK